MCFPCHSTSTFRATRRGRLASQLPLRSAAQTACIYQRAFCLREVESESSPDGPCVARVPSFASARRWTIRHVRSVPNDTIARRWLWLHRPERDRILRRLSNRSRRRLDPPETQVPHGDVRPVDTRPPPVRHARRSALVRLATAHAPLPSAEALRSPPPCLPPRTDKTFHLRSRMSSPTSQTNLRAGPLRSRSCPIHPVLRSAGT